MGLAKDPCKHQREGEGRRQHTKRPNLRGDVLELAETLRDGVGCCIVNSSWLQRHRKPGCDWPTAVLLLLRLVSKPFARLKRKARGRTGTGLRRAMVCLTKSWGLWRIAIIRVVCIAIIRDGCMAIMRVGCMDRARVALNMVGGLLCLQLGSGVESWRRRWRSKGLHGFRHRHAESSLAELDCPENAERIVCGQSVSGGMIATSQLHLRHHFAQRRLPLPPRHLE